MRIKATISAAILATLFSGTALAECSLADLQGTWFFSGLAVDSDYYPYVATTSYCKVQIGSSGNIIANSSSCINRDQNGRRNSNITGGRLSINQYCQISGNILGCSQYGCASTVIDSARLDRQKTAINAIAFSSQDRDIIGALVGIKRGL